MEFYFRSIGGRKKEAKGCFVWDGSGKVVCGTPEA